MLLQDKPLHERRRIAIIATGVTGAIIAAVFVYSYINPIEPKWDIERGISGAYTTVLEKIQSLFHRK
ncbi:MAG: hypothetical protein V4478_02730 [Patescibacteria group bacterium]